MKKEELKEVVYSATFANLGFVDSTGVPNIRMVFCTFHNGIKKHLISTNTSSMHVQEILKNQNACLYFTDSSQFKGLCLTGKAIVHQDTYYREMMWHEEDIMYYPKGVTDEDYCVIEFVAQKGYYYGNMQKGELTLEQLEDTWYGTEWEHL